MIFHLIKFSQLWKLDKVKIFNLRISINQNHSDFSTVSLPKGCMSLELWCEKSNVHPGYHHKLFPQSSTRQVCTNLSLHSFFVFRDCCYFNKAPKLKDKSIVVSGVIIYKDRLSEEHNWRQEKNIQTNKNIWVIHSKFLPTFHPRFRRYLTSGGVIQALRVGVAYKDRMARNLYWLCNLWGRD